MHSVWHLNSDLSFLVSILSTGEDPRQVEEKEDKLDASAADMNRHKVSNGEEVF